MLSPFNRRYIGNKNSISKVIIEEIMSSNPKTFVDLFAGTASIPFKLINRIESITINDNLFHNFVIYKAFFMREEINEEKIENIIKRMNNFSFVKNIFSDKYGEKFFTIEDSSKIWQSRMLVENIKDTLSEKEYYYLIAVITFAADKASRSVGHFESFLRSGKFKKVHFKKLKQISIKNKVDMRCEDANELAGKITKSDVVYLDPPYNSRQYAYFYHVLETISLGKINENTVFNGVANKPESIKEKRSLYSTSKAPIAFKELIVNIKAKKIIVSYNNTFSPKSSSSKNKISYDEIVDILSQKGELTIKEINHKFFNAGKTDFSDHKELLFIVEVRND